MIAASVVATLSAVALLTLSGDAAQAGTEAADRGLEHATGPIQIRGPVIATRGEVDVDGNDVIDLSGSDIEAIVTLKMVIDADFASGIDLTPPYTADDTGIDPDFSTSQLQTVISLITEQFNVTSSSWTVTFPGDDDGDSVLEKGERAEITIWLHPLDTVNGWYDLGIDNSDPYVDSAGDALIERGRFAIRINPRESSETSFEYVLPIELTSTLLLE